VLVAGEGGRRRQAGDPVLPVAALDASSGWYFVSRLAAKMSLAAVVIMIAEGAFGSSAGPRRRWDGTGLNLTNTALNLLIE
jgi:hypothetical protein